MLLPFSFLLRNTFLPPTRCMAAGMTLTQLLFSGAICATADGAVFDQRPLRILAFGDSLVAGFAVPQKAGFTAQLEKALQAAGCAATVINAGIPGDTSAGGRARLETALGIEPDLVLLELGANDNLLGLAPATLEANLEAILQVLRQRKIPVLLTGIEPLRDLGADYRTEFIKVFARLAEKYQLPFYADFLDGVAGRPELNKNDGIHPNPKGVKEIVRRLLPLVIETLEKLSNSSA